MKEVYLWENPKLKNSSYPSNDYLLENQSPYEEYSWLKEYFLSMHNLWSRKSLSKKNMTF